MVIAHIVITDVVIAHIVTDVVIAHIVTDMVIAHIVFTNVVIADMSSLMWSSRTYHR